MCDKLTEDITRSWETFKLNEDEKEGLTLPDEEALLASIKGHHCILAKIFNDRVVNREAFQTTMAKAWKPEGRLTFKEFGDTKFLLELQLHTDKEKIMKGRPWSFDRHLICFCDFDGNLSPSEVQFMSKIFWVQIHNLPFAGMNRDIGSLLASGLGKVLEIEVDTNGYCWGSYLRARVEVNITKALPRGRFLKVGARQHWIDFKYKHLPTMYFKCGPLMHGKGTYFGSSQYPQVKE